MVDITWKGNVTWCLNVVIKQFLYRFFFYNELFFYDLFRFLSSTVEHLHSKTGIRPSLVGQIEFVFPCSFCRIIRLNVITLKKFHK